MLILTLSLVSSMSGLPKLGNCRCECWTKILAVFQPNQASTFECHNHWFIQMVLHATLGPSVPDPLKDEGNLCTWKHTSLGANHGTDGGNRQVLRVVEGSSCFQHTTRGQWEWRGNGATYLYKKTTCLMGITVIRKCQSENYDQIHT
jgi:hypothetical protein